MSQKYIKSQNKNSHNAKSFGKYYAKPVYDEKFVETDEIADFIQTCSRNSCRSFFVIPRLC